MNFWPSSWFQKEERLVENQNRLGDEFAEFLRQQIVEGSAGSNASPATQLVANLVGRSFASATISGARLSVQEALQPSMLFRLGRQLILDGQSLWFTKFSNSKGLQLFNVSQHDIEGGYDPQTHTYRIELEGPTLTTEIRTTRGRVLHFQYVSATGGASVFSQLASRLVEHFRDESRSPRGTVAVVPDSGDDKTQMVTDLGESRGHVNIFKSARLASPQSGSSGWQLHRLGMAPDENMVNLNAQVFNQMLSLHGVSAGLFSGSAGGGREGFRQLVAQLVTPMSLLVTEELRTILDQPELTMQFSGLKSADIIGRSRAYSTLTDEKLSKDEALVLSGLRS